MDATEKDQTPGDRPHEAIVGRRKDRQPRRAPIAALDLGTNNCRLLIAEPSDGTFSVVDAFSRAVRLGEGVAATEWLSSEAQDRALKALRICASKIRSHRVRDVRFVATEACRRARNGSNFVRRVARETGLALDIISPEEEARLAVAGCAPLIDPEAEHLLVFDIGGGSTELIWVAMAGTPPTRRRNLIRALAPLGRGQRETATARAAAAHIVDWTSVPLGVSTLHDRFSDMRDLRERHTAMSNAFREYIVNFASDYAIGGPKTPDKLQIIGVSGTATTFGALHLGLKTYDRSKVDGLWVPCGDAAKLANRMLDGDAALQNNHSSVGRGRGELVVSGSSILTSILETWPVNRFRVADRGLREGILYGLLEARKDAQPG